MLGRCNRIICLQHLHRGILDLLHVPLVAAGRACTLTETRLSVPVPQCNLFLFQHLFDLQWRKHAHPLHHEIASSSHLFCPLSGSVCYLHECLIAGRKSFTCLPHREPLLLLLLQCGGHGHQPHSLCDARDLLGVGQSSEQPGVLGGGDALAQSESCHAEGLGESARDQKVGLLVDQ